MADSVSILIAEDQDIARLGLKMTLEKVEGVKVVGEAADGEAIVALAKEHKPDIILMDIEMPKVNGIEATQQIKATQPDTRIIMFTSNDSDDTVFASLRAGADGYCIKNIPPPQLSIAINCVMTGAAWLDPTVAGSVRKAMMGGGLSGPAPTSPEAAPGKESGNRHLEVVSLVSQGRSKEQISAELGIPIQEVESVLRDILSGVLSDEGSTVQTESTSSSNAKGIKKKGRNRPQELEPGTVFAGKYIIKSILGEGGMSIVYDAEHEYMQRRVAIKLLRENLTDHEESMARFKREAQAMSSIQHKYLVTVYDSGVTENGQPYIIMDYLDGMSLEEFMEDEPPETLELITIFSQVCEALDAAHRKNLVHRDLKPSNIMLVANEEGDPEVKLVDFGIAKFMKDDPDMRLTQAGEVFGTPPFMSPEQCKGEDLDPRSDIYSLGCVMYESFTGERAFTASTLYEVLTMQVTHTPSREPFRRSNSKLMAELEKIVFQCLEKDRNRRPPSALHLQQAILNAYRTTK